MSSERDEPTQRTDKSPETPEPADGPKEIVDAAAQESEVPADETDEG
jgi:hypothetical protein